MSFRVSVTPFEKEGSNICELAHIYLNDCFLINNVSLLQGKKGVFVSMPSYKTRQLDDQKRPVYQDICFPITKEFREKLNDIIMLGYEQAKEEMEEDITQEQTEGGVPIPKQQEPELLFR